MKEVRCYVRIREVRKERNLTQKELAFILNIRHRTYMNYESGKSKVPVLVLMKLASFYNTSVDYLLEQTDERCPH